MEINQNENQKPEDKGLSLILNKLELDTTNRILLFQDQFKESYAAIDGLGTKIYSLDSEEFQQWIFNFIYDISHKNVNDTHIKAAIKILKHKAADLNFPLAIRVAKDSGKIYYDLGSYECIEIKESGWEIVENQSILFRRFKHQRRQVEPALEGDLDSFLSLINVSNKKDEILLKVYLIAAMIPDFPHPVLVVQGPQGSAKSTLCRFVKDLIDPSEMETESLHGDKGIPDFIQAASHHWLLVLDNLSKLTDSISDVISRICTGGGLSKRKLWTNDDDYIYNFKHLVALNGITQVVNKPDLLDRSLIIQLERISENNRLTEDELWKKYQILKPAILGAIFTAVAKAMSQYDSIKIQRLPRMADFVKWGCAIAISIGYSQEEFLNAYQNNTNTQTEAAAEANALVTVIVEVMEGKDSYEDTTGAVYKTLTEKAENLSLRDSYGWPKAANAFTRQIPILQPVLQALGLRIESWKSGKRKIRISRIVGGSTQEEVPSIIIETELPDSWDGMDALVDINTSLENNEINSK